MSAEVPKLHRRLPLGEIEHFGDRPPAEVLVVLSDPAGRLPFPSLASVGDERNAPHIDDCTIAFPALHRFEYV
ncbi:MAG TPA: hypothetical protein VJL81_02950 [Solirubrobacterales bacterium]|nr:hypothetical protein [Solirubrobacterales bacterium]